MFSDNVYDTVYIVFYYDTKNDNEIEITTINGIDDNGNMKEILSVLKECIEPIKNFCVLNKLEIINLKKNKFSYELKLNDNNGSIYIEYLPYIGADINFLKRELNIT